jgi:hypothetical protein
MCIPAPQAWRTCVIILSGWLSGATGMACADAANVKAKVTAINLIIFFSCTKSFDALPSN